MTGLLTIVLWPSQSFAAIIPACENDFVSRVVLPAAPPADGSCDPAANADDIDDSRAAPICDARGASAVAPPRLRGVSDMGLDRGHRCDAGETAREAVNPWRGDPPVKAPEALVDQAILTPLIVIASAAEVHLLDPLAPTGGPRMGIRNDIFHPPR